MKLVKLFLVTGLAVLCCSITPATVIANEENAVVEYDISSLLEENQYNQCDPRTQPSPHWGMKGGQCLKSCGALGGNRGLSESCERYGMRDMGNAYDVPYCCAGEYRDDGRGRNQCTDRYGRRVPCDDDRGRGQCTDRYGRRVPCDDDYGRGQCTDRYGRRVPCDDGHGRNPPRECTDRWGRRVPCR